MNYNFRHFIAITLGLFIIVTACKKNTSNKTTCTSTLHAYTAVMNPIYTGLDTCSQGIINMATGSIATAGSFLSIIYFTNQAAFNTSDNCYYIFKSVNYGIGSISASALYKINAAGTATILTPPDTFGYSSIAYNSATNKLYCNRNGSLAEITIGASSYTATNLVAPIHPFARQLYSPGNITVDNATGDMYYATGDTSNYYIEKYHPGTTTSTVVASGTNGYILELRFNKNDNMLYAIKAHEQISFDFIKINPTAGTTTTVVVLGLPFNVDMYSATLDPCSDHYILSTIPSLNLFVVYQLNMAGAIVHTDTTATFYQGLVAY